MLWLYVSLGVLLGLGLLWGVLEFLPERGRSAYLQKLQKHFAKSRAVQELIRRSG